ncbi:ATP-binding protein [Solidesulfovibrio sp.]|uniref:ATP-binding protein n=1 Tax=Solidesulfovibrio sp. TaxID=2910990 RepID=UPI002B2195B9|nr:ATP-binding protein [Solidesulfovibrio sp.]MEA4855377.1 ATP-binding protein [Solidesulfovibrio sp.]
MNKRTIFTQLMEALADTPVVFLRGARQTGKTTLVKQLAEEVAGEENTRQYISLDSATALAGALDDPTGFLQGLKKPVIIDEAQRASALMLAIKEDVDRERQAGRYLLTGSANILTLQGIADSLAGRMEVLTLYPLSQGEIAGTREDFIRALFQKNFPFQVAESTSLSKEALLEAIVLGGYPEVLSRATSRRRAAWFDSYITTLVERDIRDIANIQDISGLIRLLRLLGARSGTLHNQAELSRSVGMPGSTLGRYIPLIEALFLIWFLPAWSSNLSKRLVKSPKLHVCDSGLACHLCGADTERLAGDLTLAGRLLESFVAGELLKQSSWTEHPVSLYHYRSQSGEEVDVILEDRAGHVAAVEVKLAAGVASHDIKGLVSLRDALGNHFARGVVVYTGQEVIPMGDRIFAIPIGMMFAG